MKNVYELIIKYPRLQYAGVTRDFLKQHHDVLVKHFETPADALFWSSKVTDAEIKLFKVDGTFKNFEDEEKKVHNIFFSITMIDICYLIESGATGVVA
jgi:hypothetical protein